MFYDVVKGDGNVRNEYGRRFEEYCARYLDAMLPSIEWEREFTYQYSSIKNITSPDILGKEDGKIFVALECKATRMSHSAMFGANPIEDRGYLELSKAVFQLWRLFCHCRLGKTNRSLSTDVFGVVLTLDNWLVLSEPLCKIVMEEAKKMAAQKAPEITAVDCKPIIFVAINELEHSLSTADEAIFKGALKASTDEKFYGWRLDNIVSEITKATETNRREYPFKKDLGTLLPWWDKLAERFDPSRMEQ